MSVAGAESAIVELFASGHVIDVILGLMAGEVLVLVALHRRTGRGIAPSRLVANFCAGLFLLLAVRGALVGAAWGWIELCLLGGMAGHFADLWQRSRA
jgi:hypothetical protein